MVKMIMLANLAMFQPSDGQQGNPLMTFLPFIALIVIFYFFLIRPQSRKQKAHQEMLKTLHKGDRIITTGGVIGTVVGVDEEKIVIKSGSGDGVKLEISKGFISQKVSMI